MTNFAFLDSPLGRLVAVADGDAVLRIHFAGQKYSPPIRSSWRENSACAPLRETIRQLREYFAGARREFTVPLAPEGTPFQREVWKALLSVRYGQTLAYSELAQRAGHPGCARAAGAANGRNPIAIVIPCHRIIGADGSLTGYAGGLERKRALLELEAGRSQLGLALG